MSTVSSKLSKRDLGDSYIRGTAVLLGCILLWEALVEGVGALLWVAVGFVPILALFGTARWFRYLEFDGEQVWTVAQYSALALGVVASCLIGVALVGGTYPFAPRNTVVLVASSATVALGGTFCGVVCQLQRSNRRLTLRNAVLHRVLRHNLRNDMTVLLCLLDQIETDANPEQREKLARARQKIDDLVELTDKVRQVNVTASSHGSVEGSTDLRTLVGRRLDHVRETHPGVRIETDFGGPAFARVGEEFGLIVDNVVQSALSVSESDPFLQVSLRTTDGSVRLAFEDHNGTIPEADLSAVATGSETDLEHGLGVELWLVYWLVNINDGEISIDTVDGHRRIEITLPGAGAGWFGRQ